MHANGTLVKCQIFLKTGKMATDPGNENEDNWLYGDSNPEPPEDTEIPGENGEKQDEGEITDEPMEAEIAAEPAPVKLT